MFGPRGGILASISAYYYTPVRGVFVGSLVAVGLGLVAIKGREGWEDSMLNLAGMLAPLVALVPTPISVPVAGFEVERRTVPAELVPAVENNVAALLVLGVVGLVFAADHGVAAAEPVSAYPPEVTGAMFDAYRQGRSTINAFARHAGATVTAIDVGIRRPTGDIRVEAALTPERFDEVVQIAVAAVGELDGDLLVLGEMGIGNTTPSAAIAAALAGGETAAWVGRGTGVDDEGLRRKRIAVQTAVRRIAGVHDPLEVLREVHGQLSDEDPTQAFSKKQILALIQVGEFGAELFAQFIETGAMLLKGTLSWKNAPERTARLMSALKRFMATQGETLQGTGEL